MNESKNISIYIETLGFTALFLTVQSGARSQGSDLENQNTTVGVTPLERRDRKQTCRL